MSRCWKSPRHWPDLYLIVLLVGHIYTVLDSYIVLNIGLDMECVMTYYALLAGFLNPVLELHFLYALTHLHEM